MICSVCIATYKRPNTLFDLIQSLFQQILPDNVHLEIIIVDNDPDRSAELVYKQIEETETIKCNYYVQPIKNISATRNLSIEKTTGEFCCFIDDDEIACSRWIALHLKTINEFKADGSFGRVISKFSYKTPIWKRNNFLFNRICPATGTLALATRTGNCMIKTELLKGITGPFDIKYGISGGEDTQLFEKLKRRGAYFVVCHEAWTIEFIPPERTKLTWLLKRSFRVGNTYARRIINFEKKHRVIKKLIIFAQASIFAFGSLLLGIVTLPSKIWLMHWTLKLSANLGKLFAVCGYIYHEYK